MQETLCSSILVDNKEIKTFTHLSFTYHCNQLKNVKKYYQWISHWESLFEKLLKMVLNIFWSITLNFSFS